MVVEEENKLFTIRVSIFDILGRLWEYKEWKKGNHLFVIRVSIFDILGRP
jgi:hypothetical protein